MTKTVWVNGTERLIEKDRYGMYLVYLDDEDVRQLNKQRHQDYETAIMVNRSEVYEEMNKLLKEKDKQTKEIFNDMIKVIDSKNPRHSLEQLKRKYNLELKDGVEK